MAIDISGSENYGSELRSKRERLAELGALLSFSANRNGDKIGLLLFSDRVEKYLPPAKGQKHVLRILREILFFSNESKGTDLNEGLRFINRVLRRRSVVFFLSDFIIQDLHEYDESAQDIFMKELAATKRKHDLVCGQIYDACEREIPKAGLTILEDAETGAVTMVDFSNKKLMEEYTRSANEAQANFQQRLRRRGIDHFEFSTTSDYVLVLRDFFRIRKNRKRS